MILIVPRAAAVALPVALTTALWAQSAGQNWPAVTPTTAQFKVDFDAERIVIDLPLLDRSGRERYHFACRGGRDRYLDALEPDSWVGPLMCTIAEGTVARASSLLSEDGSPAWFSRAQFQRRELVGACGKYPEFGLRRSFRLRGFRLVLDGQDVAVDAAGEATSFVLKVSVTPDPSALSAQAERPGFLDPRGAGQSCDVVRRGAEPRMCRDASGSWVPCKE